MSTFNYKYNDTIEGLELDVIPRKKLHGHADKLSLLLSSLLFVEQEANPTEHPLRLSAGGWNVERRGISLPASTVLEVVASFASTNPKYPCPRPELTLFCTCKQTTTNSKY